jgi:hypothetical protein
MPPKAEKYRFHYDPRDTPQQRAILRRQRTAQWVRHHFPVGTRVTTREIGSRVPRPDGWTGTVVRHVPGQSADGGSLIIDWDPRDDNPFAGTNANPDRPRGCHPGGIIPIGGFKS